MEIFASKIIERRTKQKEKSKGDKSIRWVTNRSRAVRAFAEWGEHSEVKDSSFDRRVIIYRRPLLLSG